ncbi:MAG: FecR domain-containing protein [Candidatus Zambryskibacteria bacterium]|nr:FecR domain-containing protein [Candidatus Zambryskibacteria bacterium]
MEPTEAEPINISTNPSQFPGPQTSYRGGAFFIAIVIILLFLGTAVVAVLIERNRDTLSYKSVPLSAVIIAINPDTFVVPATGREEMRVEKALEVKAGMELRTSRTGEAALVYPNGALTILGPDTQVVIESLEEGGNSSRLHLLAGGIWTRLERLLKEEEKYEVRSGGLVTSVRGTEFEIEAQGETIAITVLSGEVALGAEAPIGSTSQFTVAAGEQASVRRDGAGLVTDQVRVGALGREEAIQRITAHSTAVSRLMANVETRKALNSDLPSAGITAEQPIFYGLERFIENLATATTLNQDRKASRLLALAEERLNEAQELAALGSEKVQVPLKEYSRLIGIVASTEASEDVRALLAEASVKHTQLIDDLDGKVAEVARPFLRQALHASEQGSLTALSALAEDNPDKALELGVEAQKQFLRRAQEQAASLDSLNVFWTLRAYDAMNRRLDILVEDDPDSLSSFAGSLTKDLGTMEMLGRVSETLSPGVTQTVKAVKNRVVDIQLTAIADVMLTDPERAVSLYTQSAGKLVDKIQKEQERGQSGQENFEELVMTYEKYAKFGADVSSLAAGLRVGDTTVKELVDVATSQHNKVLENVARKVPAEAERGIKQAISASEVEPTPEPPPTPTESMRVLERFVEQKKTERPSGELELPLELPTEIPTPAPTSGERELEERKTPEPPTNTIIPESALPRIPDSAPSIQTIPASDRGGGR